MFSPKLGVVAAMAIGPICAQSITPGDFFETKIRPVLANNCFACHNSKLKTAGLDLSSAAAFQQGSPSGPIISKDDPDSSKLVQVLRYQGAIKMPPMGKLPDQQIADVTAWVKLGAPWPEAATPTVAPQQAGKYQFTPEQKAFWSFQP